MNNKALKQCKRLTVKQKDHSTLPGDKQLLQGINLVNNTLKYILLCALSILFIAAVLENCVMLCSLLYCCS